MAPDVGPGTIALYTDVVCGWSTVALSRLLRARDAAGLRDEVHVDHRLFLLEDINRFPIPKRYLDAEIPVLGGIEPDVGWTVWQREPSEWPVSSLLANEAVHAAKDQGLAVAEELDWALRLAFFRDSRCITLLHEVLDVASSCPSVDGERLREALVDGRARGPMLRQMASDREHVQGSPHLFFADGTDVHNPGIELHWQGDPGEGYPVVDRDDASVWDGLVRRAVS